MSKVREEAIAQTKEGCDILDVNVGYAGVDEKIVLTKAVQAAELVTDLPIAIDTTNIEAMEKTLKKLCGKALNQFGKWKKREYGQDTPAR